MRSALSIIIAAAPDHARALLEALRRGGLEPRPTLVSTPVALSQALDEDHSDLLLTTDDLPELSLASVLELAGPRRLPVLLASGSDDPRAARAALEAGADDVIWPAHIDRLALAVQRALLNAQATQAAAQHEAFVNSPAVQLLLDPSSGEVVEANAAAAAFYGYSPAELRGMTVWQLGGSREGGPRGQAKAPLEPGNVMAARHRIATGELRDVEVRAGLLHKGGRQLIFSTVSDITERLQRERELEAVAAFAAALRSAPSRAALVPAILEQLRTLAAAERTALVMRDPASDELVVELAVNWSERTGARLPPGRGLAGQVIASGQPEWRDWEAERDAEPAGRAAQPYVVGVPLVAQGQTLGALCLSSATPPGAGQLRLLNAIGDMTANALHRQALHEQTEQRVQRLAALHAIEIAISASFDLRVTLDIFLDHLMSQVQVDAAAVLLLKPATHILEYGARRGLATRPLAKAPLRLTDSVPGRVVSLRQPLHISHLSEARPPGTQPYPPGQANFVGYYGLPLVAKGQVLGVLEVLSRGPLRAGLEWVEFLNSLATQAAIAIDSANLFSDLQRSNVELNQAYEATIEGWSRVLEARGVESSGHTRRVADLTVRLAQTAGFSAAELVHVRRGALLHDVGMLSVPESLLVKPGPLSPAERAVVQQHPDYGFSILAPIVYLRQALDIPLCHHERWDGSGYPRGLSGDVIPRAARLFAVVDTWDALRADRPYRAAWTPAAAAAYLQTNAGQLFDPAMVTLFLESGGG